MRARFQFKFWGIQNKMGGSVGHGFHGFIALTQHDNSKFEFRTSNYPNTMVGNDITQKCLVHHSSPLI